MELMPAELNKGISKCKVQREGPAGQTVETCTRGENIATAQQLSNGTNGHSSPQSQTDTNNSKSKEHERQPVPAGRGSGVLCEASEKPRATVSGGSDKSPRPSGTPLRLRRLPASFWQEPNVPKDPSGKLMSTVDGCFGSCSCQLFRRSFQNDSPPFGYGDDGFRSKYLDPVSPPAFHRSGHSFTSISKLHGDPLELAYLDTSVAPWRQGAASFPSAPAGVVRGEMRPVFADRSGSFSATAALYGHMMRRSLHGNYYHNNDVLADHLVSPIVSDDLWRLLPNRPLMNDFSKRFHPYL